MSSPTPKPRWATRMGSVGTIMRRTTSILNPVSRPATPSIASDGDADKASLSGSIKSRETSLLSSPPLPPGLSSPSPIAESPLREAAATAQEIVGPSPLTQPTTSFETVPSVAATVPPLAEETQSPTVYFPPPVLDSTVGNPGAFTDEPDELPQPDTAQDPYAVAPVEPHIELATIDAPSEPTAVILERTHPYESEPEATLTEVVVEEPTSYFDEPIAESIKDLGPTDNIDNTTEFNEAIPENANTFFSELDFGHGEAVESDRGDVILATSEAVHENANVVLHEPDFGQEEAEAHHHDVITTEHERQEEIQQTTEPISILVPLPNYELPSYPINLGSGPEIWGGEHDYGHEDLHHPYESTYPSSMPIISPSSTDLKRAERSPAPSIRMPEVDPFADPIAPRITVSRPELDMPQAEISEERHQHLADTHRDIPIVMPLPSFNTVTSSNFIHHTPSTSSLRDENTGKFGMPVETDETLPLLSRPGSPNKHKLTSYLQTSANFPSHAHSHNVVSVSPLVFSASQSTASNGNANSWNPHLGSHPRLHTLGWLEYHLPDGTVYYVHPTSRITTEINLRSERILTGVERFLADHGKDHSGAGGAIEETVATGGEIWLRDVGTAKSGMVLEKWWVDHRVRTVVMLGDEHEHARKRSGKGKAKGGVVLVEEDQLDTEYRYWSFMEAHPAHNTLPAKTKIEAMDVLTWAWTERLLPSHRTVPAPFTQDECHELMTLIRSFGDDHHDDHDDHGIQTRIVSRILLRVAHWRQTYFRPNKPLPTNVGCSPSRLPIGPRKPFRRAIIDFVVSCLFLGIPYIFFERTRLSSRIDEESGVRNTTPTLVIGACTCLIAAIVLSASVTFLSLPGLDAFSRTAGMVAILFAAFSMAATVVAIFRHKADLERPILHIGIEGIMVITRRTVILSLPIVFLAYSTVAFITGIVLYSFRGVTLSDPSMTRKSFEDYTRWGVVTVIGVLAGMVMTSVLLLKR